MEFTHTMNEVEVFHVKRLNVFGQSVVIRTLSCLELLCLVVFLELRAVFYDGINLLLQDDNLVVGFDFTARFEEGTELALDELSLSLGIDAEITIHYGVVGELEKKDCTLVPVTLCRWRVEPLLEFVSQIVHIL